MFEDLFLLRWFAPRAFRGVRFLAWMLFWMTFFVLGIAVVAGLLSPEQTSPAHAAKPTLERRAH